MTVADSGAGPASGSGAAAQAPSSGEVQGATAGNADDVSLAHLFASLWRDLPGLISDRVHLVALELRRARQAVVQMVALVVLAAILAATAWIALWAFVIAAALNSGLPWYGTLLLVLSLNLAGGWVAVRRVRRLAGYLALPATVRRLTTAPSSRPVMPAAEAHRPTAGAREAGAGVRS